MVKTNWFNTLWAALDSEDLNDKWTLGLNIGYGETGRMITEDHILISIFRNTDGKYERPVHYKTV